MTIIVRIYYETGVAGHEAELRGHLVSLRQDKAVRAGLYCTVLYCTVLHCTVGEGGAGAGLHTAGGHAQTPPRPRHPGTVPPLPPVTRYCEDDIQRPVFTTTDCAGAHLAHYDSTTLGSCWAGKGSCVVRHRRHRHTAHSWEK